MASINGSSSFIHTGKEKYPYMAQLKALDACHPLKCTPVCTELKRIVSPLQVEVWEQELSNHPDQQFAAYIIAGIRYGFRIGYNRLSGKLRDGAKNMISALEHPEVVDEYLDKELSLNRMSKVPSDSLSRSQFHISPFGVIPKKSKPGQWRLITDLSTPKGGSINDGIDKVTCSLSYVSIDEIVNCILELGKGALMAKIDIKEAYRNIPVHPDDRYLLGVAWKDSIMVDKVLPFGLRSAPIIFTAIADALQWIIQQRGVNHLFHYLDDFITVGPKKSSICHSNLSVIIRTCVNTGTPVEEGKTEGPSSTIKFLGMELDSEALEIRLPEEKLKKLRALLGDWKGRKAIKKRDLLSLIGSLQHAAKAVRQGRSFVRRLINLSMVVENLDSYIRLNISARSDIRWWFEFAKQWNGTSMLFKWDRLHPQSIVTSDASGHWGCGAYVGDHWFQFQWPSDMDECHITIKELIPIVMAAAIWGHEWVGQSVRFQCDNAAVVAIVNSGSSRDPFAMHLVRCLAFITARFNFVVSSSHIHGVDNILADALSRNRIDLFRVHFPQAQRNPATLPPALVDMLISSRPDWTSPHWTRLWSSIFTTR